MHTHSPLGSRLPAVAGTTLWLVGCASLDPTADYQEAASLVQERSGWQADWSVPWSDSASPWDGISSLSIDQAVTVALQNNRGLRAALENIASARADLVQSGLLPNPVLSATFGTAIGGEGGAASLSVSFVQQLTDLWLRPARMDAAASALREQILGVSDEALRLVADARQAHALLVGSQRGVALTRSHLDLVARSIEVTRQRVAAGEAARLDVNRLRQLSLGLQADLARQELELDRQKREVLALMGLAGAHADWQAQDEQPLLEQWSNGLAESEVIELATRQRLDVAAARTTRETALQQLRVTRGGSLPEIAAGPAYDRDEDRRDELGAGIDLEVPIFDTNRARIAKAMSELRRAQVEADRIRQEAVTQTRSAWLDLRTNLELLDFYREHVR